MTVDLDAIRAAILAAEEGYPVHIRCMAEVVNSVCQKCGAMLADAKTDTVVPPGLSCAVIRESAPALIAEIDRLRKVEAAVNACGPRTLHYAAVHVMDAADRSRAEHGGSVSSVTVARSCEEAVKKLCALADVLNGKEPTDGE